MRTKAALFLLLCLAAVAMTGLYSEAAPVLPARQTGERELFSSRQLPHTELETQNPLPGVTVPAISKQQQDDLQGQGKPATATCRKEPVFFAAKTVGCKPAYLFHIYPSHHFW